MDVTQWKRLPGATVNGIEIIIREAPSGLLFATSEADRGLLVSERTREELLAAVPQAMAELAEARVSAEGCPQPKTTPVDGAGETALTPKSIPTR